MCPDNRCTRVHACRDSSDSQGEGEKRGGGGGGGGGEGRPWRIMPAEKLAEFGTFSGKFHACLVCG